jgi:hypothetical protein
MREDANVPFQQGNSRKDNPLQATLENILQTPCHTKYCKFSHSKDYEDPFVSIRIRKKCAINSHIVWKKIKSTHTVISVQSPIEKSSGGCQVPVTRK